MGFQKMLRFLVLFSGRNLANEFSQGAFLKEIVCLVFLGERVHNVLMGECLSAGEGVGNNLTEGQLYLLRARALHFLCCI